MLLADPVCPVSGLAPARVESTDRASRRQGKRTPITVRDAAEAQTIPAD